MIRCLLSITNGGTARSAAARTRIERKRQVIVFTHDVVFLLAIRQFAEELDIAPLDQHVRFLSKGAGVCSDELPWGRTPGKEEDWLSEKLLAGIADQLSRDGHQDAYEKDAKYIYGLFA